MKFDDFINEYEAALRFNFSPTLLRWMTKNGVVDNTKLNYKIVNELYYFNVQELTDLNKKMEGRWPKTSKGQRPGIPTEIKNEIKREAMYSCPACNKNIGEVAHIDPVSATHCNHPKNLIFLCPNHHTEYDNAKIPSNIDRDEVIVLKKSLQIFHRAQWKIKGETISTLLGALNEMRSLLKIRGKISDSVPEGEFKDTLINIAKLSSEEKALTFAHNGNIARLDEAVHSYIAENTENICPLCNGQGHTSYYDPCPVCDGNGELPPSDSRNIDLSVYDLVDCKLCNGRGIHLGNNCPACIGDCQIPRYRYDHDDWGMYDLVACKLCNGRGSHSGNECRPCSAEGYVSKFFYDNHDWSMHNLVSCKLCDGRGTYQGGDCLPCGGVGDVSQAFFDNHDWSSHDLTNCKLCRGKGSYLGYDCIPCNGEGSVSEYFYFNHDWSQYEMVECNLCRGEGRYHAQECIPCGGEGKLSRHVSENLNWSDYRNQYR